MAATEMIRKTLGVLRISGGLHLELQVLAPKGDEYHLLEPKEVVKLGVVLQRLGEACAAWQQELEQQR